MSAVYQPTYHRINDIILFKVFIYRSKKVSLQCLYALKVYLIISSCVCVYVRVQRSDIRGPACLSFHSAVSGLLIEGSMLDARVWT